MPVALASLLWLAANGAYAQPGNAQPRAPDQAGKTRSPLINARTMTLREMTEAADKIFQGKVAKVGTEEVELKGRGNKSAKVRVNVITFDVTRKLKGDVEVGKPLEVRQLPTASVPIQVGEEVLWYLAKPGKSGFTAPLGMYSGHFKVLADPEHPQAKVTVNLVDNKGLWSPTTPLAESDARLDRKQFAEALGKKALTPARAARIMTLASKPNRPGPLPLELVTTATESLMSSQP